MKDWRNKKCKFKFAEQIIDDYTEFVRTDASERYGQAVGTHFPNGVTTIYTVSLGLNSSTGMGEVSKAKDANYSIEDENDDRCGYRTVQQGK